MLVFLLLIFSLAGCSHRPPDPVVPSAPPKGYLHQDRTTPSSASGQIKSDIGKTDKDYLNEDFSSLNEEVNQEAVQVADPLAPWNHLMFRFNDRLYFWVLKPLEKRYVAVVPKPIRSSLFNFFHNLDTPVRLVSCALQGRVRETGDEFARFMLNSTVGILGFRNPAKKYPALNPKDDEDLGQVFASYGIGNGCYIVWPILGPSTARDFVGTIGHIFLNPITYINPVEASLGTSGVKSVNKNSFDYQNYESLKKASLDPYIGCRHAYIQHRKKEVEE
ncbi:MAG: VacJ family lipoprotein [Nitrospiraceae bacterium]|nr:VacJ family lipoprotein [Nitrospiraceae bacterium]